MLRRIAVLALCSLAGLVLGVEASWYGGHYDPGWFGLLGGYRYYFYEGILLPHGSDARHLVAVMNGQHPGVQVTARSPRLIAISATGSFQAGQLVTKAGQEVVALNDGKVRNYGDGFARDLAGDPAAYGLLAGLGTGLGFAVPRRRRAPS